MDPGRPGPARGPRALQTELHGYPPDPASHPNAASPPAHEALSLHPSGPWVLGRPPEQCPDPRTSSPPREPHCHLPSPALPSRSPHRLCRLVALTGRAGWAGPGSSGSRLRGSPCLPAAPPRPIHSEGRSAGRARAAPPGGREVQVTLRGRRCAVGVGGGGRRLTRQRGRRREWFQAASRRRAPSRPSASGREGSEPQMQKLRARPGMKHLINTC
ncbi:WAS/WASL-interacting protein family member 3-like [Bubalus bubalis]|uniref:WAS/WASL-interacting protein family member 3-like n=1 Tax=Bubalus bubalis TaxID=89462 RepID=UPI001E1B762B|nr:WAS/WASL-interacting protein family member 3-like [Bubalus bubalis]